jgi:hypothetical protein
VRGAAAASAATFLSIVLVSRLHSTSYNNYVLLADAFLHGHAWITWPGEYIDALSYEGKRYIIEGPMPAILLMPFVAFFGTSVNQTLLAAALAGVAVGAGWEIARRLGCSLGTRFWLCGFLLLGTDLFWCAMGGAVWFIAHVSAAAFTLLALLELQGKRRAWLTALYAVCAAESRFTLVLALPFYAFLLAGDAPPAKRHRAFLGFCATFVPFALLWIAYNEARWHLPYDIGYTMWYHQDPVGSPTGSPFQLRYLHEQVNSFFLRFPEITATYPYVIPTYAGVALTWTSPALLLALWARVPRRWAFCLWGAAALTMIPNLLYYVNGSIQFGMRHALDFEPFLFVLMALASRPRLHPIGAVLCVYSMLVGVWGIWYWLRFYSLV